MTMSPNSAQQAAAAATAALLGLPHHGQTPNGGLPNGASGAVPSGAPVSNGVDATVNSLASSGLGGFGGRCDTHLYGTRVVIHGTKLEGSKGVITGFIKDTNE